MSREELLAMPDEPALAVREFSGSERMDPLELHQERSIERRMVV